MKRRMLLMSTVEAKLVGSWGSSWHGGRLSQSWREAQEAARGGVIWRRGPDSTGEFLQTIPLRPLGYRAPAALFLESIFYLSWLQYNFLAAAEILERKIA